MSENHTIGRPPIYKSPEEMQKNIDMYFKEGSKKKIIVDGKNTKVSIPTITGLTLFLGFGDRASFYDYGKKEIFSHTIKRARLRIAEDYEIQLRTQSSGQAGTIFGLKNIDGWRDKQPDDDLEDRNSPIIPIVFSVNPAVGEVKITRGEDKKDG